MSAAGTRHGVGGGTLLWVLAAPPSIWAAHFLLSYATGSVWCAKFAGPGGSLAFVRGAIAVYTAVALAAVAVLGGRGYRQHRHESSEPPHDDDTPESRTAFVGFATLLLSGLSAIAIVYSALVAVVLRTCR
jgi:hypothetical protein